MLRLSTLALLACSVPALAQEINVYSHRQPELIQPLVDAFTAETGAAVQVNVFGSNEEMLAKLQAGGSGWDVFVPTNYTITTYVEQDLIEPLDLALLPNYDAASFDQRFAGPGTVDGKVYAVPKNWGTTGFAVNTNHTGGTTPARDTP